MRMYRLALVGAGLLTVSLPVLAQPGPGGGPGPRGDRGPGAMFDRMDANRDGRVAWDEAWGYVQQRFRAADPDNDGSLTQQEMAAARIRPDMDRPGPGPAQGPERERMMGMMFRALDANRDGVVTLEEVRPAVEARFRAFDANGDGAVTRDELPARPRPQRPPAQQQPG